MHELLVVFRQELAGVLHHGARLANQFGCLRFQRLLDLPQTAGNRGDLVIVQQADPDRLGVWLENELDRLLAGDHAARGELRPEPTRTDEAFNLFARVLHPPAVGDLLDAFGLEIDHRCDQHLQVVGPVNDPNLDNLADADAAKLNRRADAQALE